MGDPAFTGVDAQTSMLLQHDGGAHAVLTTTLRGQSECHADVFEANNAFEEDFGSVLGRKCYEAYKHRQSPCEPCPVQWTLSDGLSHTREEVVTSRTGSSICP